jgi:hypothetical protein
MSKKKGDRRENQAVDILEDSGWSVETPNSTPYPQPYGVDFFGLFDFVAFKDGCKPLFGQVKSNGPRGIRSFSDDCSEVDFPFDFARVEYWTCYDSEGWRIDVIDESGYQTVLDERDSNCNMGEDAIQYKSD